MSFRISLSILKYLFLSVFIILIYSPGASGQYYFGQNKVQYTDFDWQVLSSEHFDVYFYPEERNVAETGARYAEDAYKQLSADFAMVIDKKIPLIIYSSPAYFTQTNVIPGLLPENVGGFTEFYKERVVVPFNGSYNNFRRVIKHELVHVFTFNKLFYNAHKRKKLRIASPPLWFTEGIAEFLSEKRDAPEIDMIVGDYYLNGRPISLYDMYYMGGAYPIYKLGQAFCQFVDSTYGSGKVMLLFENWHKGEDFEEILTLTLGESFDEINKKWMYSQKKKYYPMLSEGDLPDFVADKLTRKGFNVKPQFYRDADSVNWIIFKANRMGYSGIYGLRLDNRRLVSFVKGERSANYESLHLLESSLAVSDNGLMAFISKKNESDQVNIYNLETRRIVDRFEFDDLVRISSPDWSPDGKKLVFSGITKRGHSDIYICEHTGEDLQRLTDDVYRDSSPKFSPDGTRIVFSSDRGIWGHDGRPGLYLFDLKHGSIRTLIDNDNGYYSPDWSSGGDSVIFTSAAGGATNIYILSGIKNGHMKFARITDLPTGAFDPAFAFGDSSIVFSSFSSGTFDLYNLGASAAEDSTAGDSLEIEPYFSSWEPPKLNGELKKGVLSYKTKYSLDIAQSVVAYDALVGPVGGLQLAFTDMLGNHQYYCVVSNSANSSRDFAKRFNIAVTYFNREKRINWGIGGYRFKYDLYNEFDGDYTEQQFGVVGLMSYPFGRFRRMELTTYLRQYEKEYILFDERIKGLLFTPYLSYIKDTSIWEQTGPIEGMRLNLTVGVSYNVKTGEQFSRLFLGDIRKYFRISNYSCFATRLFYITSGGKDPQRYFLGGSWSLRGYGFRSFYGRNIFLSSSEIRFPLIDAIFIGLPVGNFDFRAIRGALFFDAGDAWDDDFDRLKGSFGLGARVNLGAFVVLRFDFAHRTDFKTVSKKTYFDFFFGWNF
ncbi:MAG: hypothetical protein GF307_14960 [candidate division Zixibacteria bacterium]|nr:hypothetical protein [candidate division Zixibacteria bacterium]